MNLKPGVYVEEREPVIPVSEDRHFRCYRCDALITVTADAAKWPSECPTPGKCWQAIKREFSCEKYSPKGVASSPYSD